MPRPRANSPLHAHCEPSLESRKKPFEHFWHRVFPSETKSSAQGLHLPPLGSSPFEQRGCPEFEGNGDADFEGGGLGDGDGADGVGEGVGDSSLTTENTADVEVSSQSMKAATRAYTPGNPGRAHSRPKDDRPSRIGSPCSSYLKSGPPLSP